MLISKSSSNTTNFNTSKILLHMIPIQEGMEFVVNKTNVLSEKKVSKVNFFEKCMKTKRDFENQVSKKKYFHLFLPFIQESYDLGYSTLNDKDNLIHISLFNFTSLSEEKFIENYRHLIKITNEEYFIESNNLFITTNTFGHSNYSII
jgi:hypothetical protein